MRTDIGNIIGYGISKKNFKNLKNFEKPKISRKLCLY